MKNTFENITIKFEMEDAANLGQHLNYEAQVKAKIFEGKEGQDADGCRGVDVRRLSDMQVIECKDQTGQILPNISDAMFDKIWNLVEEKI